VSLLRQLGTNPLYKKKTLVSIFAINFFNLKYVYIRTYYSPELSIYLFIYLFIYSFFLSFWGGGKLDCKQFVNFEALLSSTEMCVSSGKYTHWMDRGQ